MGGRGVLGSSKGIVLVGWEGVGGSLGGLTEAGAKAGQRGSRVLFLSM